MKKKAILKALKLYFGQEAEHPLDFCVKVSSNMQDTDKLRLKW